MIFAITNIIILSPLDIDIKQPITKDKKANRRNLPFNLISGFSDLNDSTAKLKPVIITISNRTDK